MNKTFNDQIQLKSNNSDQYPDIVRKNIKRPQSAIEYSCKNNKINPQLSSSNKKNILNKFKNKRQQDSHNIDQLESPRNDLLECGIKSMDLGNQIDFENNLAKSKFNTNNQSLNQTERDNELKVMNQSVRAKVRPASAKLSIMVSNSKLKTLLNNKENNKMDSSRNQIVIDQSVDD